MKKRYFLATSALAVMTLAACGDTAEPVKGTQDESSLTLQEVFDKAIERQQALKSVHADINMEQIMEMDIMGEITKFTTSSNLAMDSNQQPLSMYSKGTIAMNFAEQSIEMPLEMYMTEADGFYMLNTETNQWLKLPSDQYEAMLADNGIQADATAQLEQLKQFVEDFDFKQDDKNYLLTLNVDGDKFKRFVMDQMGTSMEGTAQIDETMMESMNFEDSKYEITINKDTFDTEQIVMDLTILTDVEGQKSTIKNDATINYTKFDEVGEITVPNEVKNKAISE